MKKFRAIETVCATIVLLAALTTIGADRPAKSPPSLPDRLERMLKGSDKPFALVIQIYIKPEGAAKFEAAAAKAAKLSRADEGCLGYEFNRDLEKPGHYTLIERWKGLGSLKKHLTKEHTKKILAIFTELGTTPRTADILAPIDAKE
jgi:quinol monooxygenase YgiN